MKFKKISFLASVLTSLSMCLSSFAAPYVCADEAESETPVFSDDFEGETISGWGVFGGSGELVLDTDNKKSGNASLNISGREKSYNSPSRVCHLQKNFFKIKQRKYVICLTFFNKYVIIFW
jgi:hypothetical protein